MSTATAFKFHDAFPLCPPSLPGGFSYVGGLSQATVMGFFWNLETLSLTVNSSFMSGANSHSMAGTVGVNAWTATGEFDSGAALGVEEVRLSIATAMFPATAGYISPGSLPSIRAPRERVCHTSNGRLLNLEGRHITGGLYLPVFMAFAWGIDPGDSSKLAIAYNFALAQIYGDGSEITVYSDSSGADGTFSFGGLTLGYTHFISGSSISGVSVSMSGSAGFFTY